MEQSDPLPPPPNEHDSISILRVTLYAREQEFCIIKAHIQQQLDIQAQMIEGLERTVSAATDRILRRLDRIEQRIRREESDSKRFNNRRSKYRA